jgi:hypothetical protein
MKSGDEINLNEILLKAAENQRDREHSDASEVIRHLSSGVLPTPEPIARILVWSSAQRRREMMRAHCYSKERQLRLGFDALVSSAQSAYRDLVRCEAALTAYAATSDDFQRHVDHTIEIPAQKEIMAFCAAYHGTFDTLRRLKKARPDLADKIDDLRERNTNEAEFIFISDLRKNLSHGSVVVPGWSISSDFIETTGTMKFSGREIISFGEWKAVSRSFIAQQDDTFSISKILAKCAYGLSVFRKELEALFASNRSDAEVDYFDLIDLIRKLASKNFIKAFLQGHVEAETDPYIHLWRFFDPETLREILRLPPRSVEQVEFIIALRAAETTCDDSLRALLYRLFRVPVELDVSITGPTLRPPEISDGWRTIRPSE